MNNHPETVTITGSTELPEGSQLRRLSPNELLQKGDYYTSIKNPPGSGLCPAGSYYYNYQAGSLATMPYPLITYRLLK